VQRGRVAAAEAHRDDARALVGQVDDAVGDVGGRALAERPAERLADRQLRVEGDAGDAPAVVGLGRDRAGDVAAVAVVVGARALLDGAADDDQALRLRAVDDLAREVLVGGADARVDDADLDAAGVGEGAEAGRVPALGRVDVRVGGAAGLAGVVEAVELGEARVVGHGRDPHGRVDLRVLHRRAVVQARDERRGVARAHDAGAKAANRAALLGRAEQRAALGGRSARLELDDDRSGGRRGSGCDDEGRERGQRASAQHAMHVFSPAVR
jgi:hypothetical protein